MSERLIIFSPLFYIWSLFIAKKLRLLESIYQRLQGEERSGEAQRGERSREPRLLLEGLLSGVGAAGWRFLRVEIGSWLYLCACGFWEGGYREVLTSSPYSLPLDNGVRL